MEQDEESPMKSQYYLNHLSPGFRKARARGRQKGQNKPRLLCFTDEGKTEEEKPCPEHFLVIKVTQMSTPKPSPNDVGLQSLL